MMNLVLATQLCILFKKKRDDFSINIFFDILQVGLFVHARALPRSVLGTACFSLAFIGRRSICALLGEDSDGLRILLIVFDMRD